MQFLRSLLESVVIVVAYVEVNLHALELGSGIAFREVKDVIALEVGKIDGAVKYVAHHGAGRTRSARSEVCGNFSDQRRHLRTYGCELLGIFESKTQRTKAAHRDARDAARPAPALNPVLLLHLRHEFFGQKVLVAHLAIGRVQEERVSAAGRKHDEIADLALAAEVFDEISPAGIQQRLFVIAQSVQVVQNRKLSRLVLIETRRKIRTIVHRARENR